MKKRMLKILSALTSLAISTAAVFSMATVSYAASSVVVAVEAFTVEVGFIVFPTEVEIGMGDTGASIIEKVLDSSKINKGNGITTTGISSISTDTSLCSIAGDITYYLDDSEIEYGSEVVTEGWLANGDFIDQSSWVFVLNNKKAATTLANYVPQNGDVIRLAYSVYGGGSDLAIDSTIYSSTNRDTLYKNIAKTYTSNNVEVDGWIESVAIDLTVDQDAIDEAIEYIASESEGIEIAGPSTPATTPSLTTKPNYTTAGNKPKGGGAENSETGITFIPAIAIAAGSGSLLLFTRKRKSSK